MNLALEKVERVTTGCKGGGEIRGEDGGHWGGCKCAHHGWPGKK